MSIMWNYLDKRRATVAALKDYDGMKFIIDSYQDDLKLAKEQMIGVSSPRYGFVPGSSKKITQLSIACCMASMRQPS